MAVQFELPGQVERSLRERLGDLDAIAKEAALVELYRQGRLARPELSAALDISRYETDGVLKRHGVTEDLMTVDELEEQLRDDLR